MYKTYLRSDGTEYQRCACGEQMARTLIHKGHSFGFFWLDCAGCGAHVKHQQSVIPVGKGGFYRGEVE